MTEGTASERRAQARVAARVLYESGDLTNDEIGERVGVSKTAIRDWAKKDGWIKGKLFDKADKASRERVARTRPHTPIGRQTSPATSQKVPKGSLVVRPNTPEQGEQTVLESAIVEIGAQVLTEVRLRQREDVTRARNLASSLLAECESLTGANDLFEMVGEMLFNPDRYGRDRLNELYQAVIQLPGRVKVLRELSDALATLITLERGVHGLPPVDPPPPGRPKPPTGVLDTPQDTYRWLLGQAGARLNAEDAVERRP